MNRNEEIKLAEQMDPEQYYITELMPKKLALDLHYVATQSFITDIGWILKTLWVLVFPFNENTKTIHPAHIEKIRNDFQNNKTEINWLTS